MTSVAPTVETRAVNGVRLYTRTVGDGPDVVVLHGGPGAHHDYLLPQFDALASGRRVRYYDQRGGGRSPVDRDVAVDWKQHVADLDALIDAWGLRPATILGYSWGGLLALLYATEHPKQVGRLALVSPAPVTAAGRAEFATALTERSNAPAIVAERERLRQSGLRDEDPDAFKRRMFELSVAGYFTDPSLSRDLTPFRVTGRTQSAVWDSLGDYDLRKGISKLRMPAMVLHGRNDPIPLHSAQETAGLLGAELTVLDRSGHVPYVEEYDRFIAALDNFLPKDL